MRPAWGVVGERASQTRLSPPPSAIHNGKPRHIRPEGDGERAG